MRFVCLTFALIFASCGKEKESKSTTFIPKGATLVAHIPKGETELQSVRVRYVWFDNTAIKLGDCVAEVKTHFDWENYKIKGLLQNITCNTSYDTAAILTDVDGSDGRKQGSAPPLTFVISQELYIRTVDVVDDDVGRGPLTLKALIERYGDI